MADPIIGVDGLRLGAGRAGFRASDRDDLVVVEIAPGSRCAAVFTSNAFAAAPVAVAKEHLRRTAPRYLLINSGNANAGTGAVGLLDAHAACELLATHVRCRDSEVLPFSTGVIGEPIGIEGFRLGVPVALGNLRTHGWEAAAAAIMTTDTVPKVVSRTCELAGHKITVTGMAKGAGMIRPDMATMLAFIATDIRVSETLLKLSLKAAVDASFNRITIDGDTSTNDAAVLMATGKSPATPLLRASDQNYQIWQQTLVEVCQDLARAIVHDGEGATKFVTINVLRGESEEECLRVAYTVAHSPLVKTALFAGDPNWGRILAAVGRSGVRSLDVERVMIALNGVEIVRDGGRAEEYSEQAGAQAMSESEIQIDIDLGRGSHDAMIWTTDLSYEYVRINAEYRT